MDPVEQERKRRVAANSRLLGVCPGCGRELTKPGYGTGSNADGNFCSLACLADFWYGSGPHGRSGAGGRR